MTVIATLTHVAKLIESTRFNYCSEDELQQGLAELLALAGYTAAREVRLSGADRIDLMVIAKGQQVDLRTPQPPGVGIEVKVSGSSSGIVRQLTRYASHQRIAALVLVTNRAAHDVPTMLNGKPVFVVRIGRVA